jgi:hypothetical protein
VLAAPHAPRPADNRNTHCAKTVTRTPPEPDHYAVLHLLPSAPPEVVKAAWRALIAREHPDAGGEHAAATRINRAYAVLGDRERRAAYDRARSKAPGPAAAAAAAAAAAPFDPADWLELGCCPFCRTALPKTIRVDTRCASCGCPLKRLPEPAERAHDGTGRRADPRLPRSNQVRVRLAGRAGETLARVKDLSLTGVGLVMAEPVAPRQAIAVIDPGFEAVAVVVQCRRASGVYTVHARLLTLALLKSAGVYVSVKV